MSEKPVPELPEDDADTDDIPGVQYASSSHPGMIAIRKRKGRRSKRHTTSDVRGRQVRIGMLMLIVAVIILDVSGRKFYALFGPSVKQVFRPVYHIFIGLHLEVIALVVAAGILVYLTPGVEDSVLRVLGIKRSSSRKR